MDNLPLSVVANILGQLDAPTRDLIQDVQRLERVDVRVNKDVPEGELLWSDEEVALLNGQGWFIRDNFMNNNDADDDDDNDDVAVGCAHEISQLHERGLLKRAGVGASAPAVVVDDHVRSDFHMWINNVDLGERGATTHAADTAADTADTADTAAAAVLKSPCILRVLRRLDRMRAQLDCGLSAEKKTQTQLTMYPKNTRGYVRHLDASSGRSARALTLLYYANGHWTSSCGGQLRIFTDDDDDDDAAGAGHVDVEPRGDRLLCFQSRVLEHEVLPTKSADRFAITYWLY